MHRIFSWGYRAKKSHRSVSSNSLMTELASRGPLTVGFLRSAKPTALRGGSSWLLIGMCSLLFRLLYVISPQFLGLFSSRSSRASSWTLRALIGSILLQRESHSNQHRAERLDKDTKCRACWIWNGKLEFRPDSTTLIYINSTLYSDLRWGAVGFSEPSKDLISSTSYRGLKLTPTCTNMKIVNNSLRRNTNQVSFQEYIVI